MLYKLMARYKHRCYWHCASVCVESWTKMHAFISMCYKQICANPLSSYVLFSILAWKCVLLPILKLFLNVELIRIED